MPFASSDGSRLALQHAASESGPEAVPEKMEDRDDSLAKKGASHTTCKASNLVSFENPDKIAHSGPSRSYMRVNECIVRAFEACPKHDHLKHMCSQVLRQENSTKRTALS